MSLTIRDKLYFNYNGIWSETFGITSVSLTNSMFDETFIADREIKESEVVGSDEPIFYGIKSKPLEFELVLAFEDGFNKSKIDEITKWLFTDYYKPLYFEGKDDRVYRCIIVGSSRLIHNGLESGYFTVTVRCNSSRLYSPVITTDKITINGAGVVDIYNSGHFDLYPEISIKKIGNGNISIENINDDNSIFAINDLQNYEQIYINSKREIIETDIVGVSRYNNINGLYPRIILGHNSFDIDGSCEISFRYSKEYKI